LHTWCLTFKSDEYQSGTWRENLKKVHTFSTIEEFSSLFNSILKPSSIDLSKKPNYMYFKEGYEPIREEPYHENGGYLQFTLHHQSKPHADCDSCWQNVLVKTLGGDFPAYDDICGIVLQMRPTYCRICVWIFNAENTSSREQIRSEIKDVTGVQDQNVNFETHRAAALREQQQEKHRDRDQKDKYKDKERDQEKYRENRGYQEKHRDRDRHDKHRDRGHHNKFREREQEKPRERHDKFKENDFPRRRNF